MSDADETTEEIEETVEAKEVTETETQEEEAVVDLDAAAEYETVADDVQDTIRRQQEQIEQLNDMVMDLSTRVADNGGVGVCPDCAGPVRKTGGWFSKNKIKCSDCGRVFHEY